MPNHHLMILPGDRIVYYSPTIALGSKDGLQSFTAIGTVRDGKPYRADMGDFSLSGATVATAMQASAPFR